MVLHDASDQPPDRVIPQNNRGRDDSPCRRTCSRDVFEDVACDRESIISFLCETADESVYTNGRGIATLPAQQLDVH